MKYRIGKQDLLDRISIWDTYLKRKVHIFACGGTAITLDIAQEKVMKNFEHFLRFVREEELTDEE